MTGITTEPASGETALKAGPSLGNLLRAALYLSPAKRGWSAFQPASTTFRHSTRHTIAIDVDAVINSGKEIGVVPSVAETTTMPRPAPLGTRLWPRDQPADNGAEPDECSPRAKLRRSVTYDVAYATELTH